MSAAEEKNLPSRITANLAWLAALLFLLAALADPAAPMASAKSLCTAQNRIWENSVAAVESHPAPNPQTPDLQRERSLGRYNIASDDTLAAESEITATGFRGSEGFELKNAPYQPVRNAAGEVNGQAYSGHAFDQMQNRGIMPSIVQNAIQTGSRFATRAGTTGYYDAVNSVRVIINSQTGRVVTVIRGAP